ncbi:MAG TPA: ABC transporter permease [Chthoniobacterales bacterium]|nr:ABC transporter permease [Chthoniobacterales bacterium]
MITDLKYALRTLLKTPSFTLIAIVTLALGIGSATAIFSVLDAVLLRPLPYPQQERIVELRELDEKGKGMPFAEPNFDDLRARSRSFEAMAKYSVWPEAVAGGNEPARKNVCAVSRDFFRVLGIAPVLGRVFTATEATEEKQVAVVSNAFWKQALGGRTNLEGVSLRFGNRSFAVIGVLPTAVEFPPNADAWYPAEIYPPNESRTAHNWRAAGRLKPGVSVERARAEIAAIGQQLKQEHGRQTDAASFGLAPLRERLVKDVRGLLLVICGAVALLLTIACSNVANLLLVRASARRKEIALRAALGASRWRLARQFVTEAVLLTLAAGALGTLLAYWGVDLIVGIYHGNLPRVGAIGVDSTVLLFALGISLLVGVVLGLVPTLHVSRGQLQTDLQDAGRGSSAGRSTSAIRNFLIVSQVALTLLLLVGAGLLGRSFQRLIEVNPGFQTESAVVMTVSMPQPEEPAAMRQLAQFYQRLLERLGALPGVTAVGGTSALPLSGNGANGTFLIENGAKPAETMAALSEQLTALAGTGQSGDAEYRVASAGYFSAMGIPLLRGRFFASSDGADSPHVALINQAMARCYWPNEDPIGQQVQFGNMDGDLRLLHIVGVVGDVRDDGLDVEPRPMIYTNYFQRPAATSEFSFVLRGQGEAAGLIAAMRREARALNPEMPTKFETLAQVLSASLDNRRFSMVMLGVFAGAALVLAMVGLYGIMAYMTSQRTAETGIRMALGAQRGDMLRLVLRHSLALVGAGMAVGLLAALAATRLLRSLLYGIGASDFSTYGAVVILLALAALIASYVPARRAMKVDPIVALRHE